MSTATPAVVLLTIDDLCKRLKTSRNTIYRLIDKNKIPAPIKFGGQNRWRSDVIEEYIANDCKLVGR